jgi:hypothetical protein
LTRVADAAARARPDEPRAFAWYALLIAALLVGTALRAWQLDIQILIDDEWHAVHKLLRSSAVDIFTHFGYADYSIPLTLYFALLRRTIGLSEWGMHVPSLVAGVGLLLVGPRLLARSCSLPVRATWALLVAISPLLVYHSKVARPYALTSVLTFVAIIAFRHWWLDRRRRDAWTYVAAALAAGWLHVITLPFTLLPFVYYGLRSLRPFDRVRLVSLLRLGIATALVLAVVLLPPLVVDWDDFSARAGQGAVTLTSLYRTVLMLAGTGAAPTGMFVAALAAFGFWCVLRREADWAAYLGTIIAAGALVVASSGAAWIEHPLVLARYLIPVMPFVLLFAAEGIVSLIATPLGWMGAVASAAIGAALLLTGPIPDEWHYPNQFWGHLRYQFDYDAAHNPYVRPLPRNAVPAFYTELASRPAGTLTLIEAPWRLESHYNALSLYQDVHRQRVRIGLVTPVCGVHDFGEYPEGTPGLRMRWLVHLTALLRGETRGADFLVIHSDARDAVTDPGAAWPDMRGCMPAIEARFGPPVYRDARITVFSLAAPRVASAAPRLDLGDARPEPIGDAVDDHADAARRERGE